MVGPILCSSEAVFYRAVVVLSELCALIKEVFSVWISIDTPT